MTDFKRDEHPQQRGNGDYNVCGSFPTTTRRSNLDKAGSNKPEKETKQLEGEG